MKLAFSLRASTLLALSFTEMMIAFVRMMILTHILGPYEFGFAAAISATYALIEQMTDIAIFRFVLSTPRSNYKEALSAAHALGIARGIFVAVCILILSYPTACVLASCNNWPSFAWLAPVAMIRSFDNLEIRVGERDYKYRPQLIASIISHGCGLIAMTITALKTESHYAYVAYLLVQAATYVVTSHFLSSTKYEATFRTPFLSKAWTFGFPLTLNGIGLAVIGQGDRLMVGSLIGLTALGFYAVITLAAFVPIGGLFRVLGPLQFAGLHNAAINSPKYVARLQLFGRAVPMIAAGYALTLVFFLKPVVMLVFGASYAISDVSLILLASIAFLRIVRTEPHTTLLLGAQDTRRLAVANLSQVIGLAIATTLVLFYPSIEFVLIGSLIGEGLGLCVMIITTRALLKAAIADYLASLIIMLSTVVSVGLLAVLVDGSLVSRLTSAFGIFTILLGVAYMFLMNLYRRAYSAQL